MYESVGFVMDRRVPRAPVGTLLTARFGEERGVGLATCLAGTGLRPDQLADPALEVTADLELAVSANLARALGNPPGLGIEVGTRFRLTSYGMWGFALISSPTLRSALDVGLRFMDLTFALCGIEARQVGREVHLILSCDDLAPELRRFAVEREAAGIQTIQRDIFATPLALDRVSFTFPPPRQALKLYKDVFGVAPEFDADQNALVFDAGLLDVPLPQANELTTAQALEHCRESLERRKARGGLSGQVRDVLVAHLSDPPSAAQVADQLHMSARTLRHRLAQEGTSFRVLLDEVRERFAEEFLSHGLRVTEIASRLGYEEVSSFSQAFRRWKGIGPRAYRATTGVL